MYYSHSKITSFSHVKRLSHQNQCAWLVKHKTIDRTKNQAILHDKAIFCDINPFLRHCIEASPKMRHDFINKMPLTSIQIIGGLHFLKQDKLVQRMHGIKN